MRPSLVPVPLRCSHLQLDPRGYPMLASVPLVKGGADFGRLSEQRKLVLATFDLCGVCGTPFGDELRWQVAFDAALERGGFVFNEPPVHEICGLYAAQVCPFVSSPYARLGDEVRKGVRRAELVHLAGFTATAQVFGQYHQAQSTAILMFEMSGLQQVHTLRDATDAHSAYAAALAQERAVVLDPAQQRLCDLLTGAGSDGADLGGVLAGAAWVIGGAFCPGGHHVQGMEPFAEAADFYDRIALELLDQRAVASFTSGDPSIAAAAEWLRSRTRLPGVLASWRTRATRLMRSQAPPTPRTAPRASATKRRRQAAAASRRANRRGRR